MCVDVLRLHTEDIHAHRSSHITRFLGTIETAVSPDHDILTAIRRHIDITNEHPRCPSGR